jgi:hypothetical protein
MICRYNVERKIIPIYVSREKNSDFAEHGIDSSLKVKCLVSKRIVHFKRKIQKHCKIEVCGKKSIVVHLKNGKLL